MVQVPERLNEEAKDLLRKFDAVTGNTLAKSSSSTAEKPKKKGFMDKVKEVFED